jgi:hypothetical protein
MPVLHVGPCQLGDLDRAKPGLDPFFYDTPHLTRGAGLVMYQHVFSEIPIGNGSDRICAPPSLTFRRWIGAAADRSLFLPGPDSRLFRSQSTVLPKRQPALSAGFGAIFEHIDFQPAGQTANTETSKLVPEEGMPPCSRPQRVYVPLCNLRHLEI